jgi:hypothetical protein
MATSRNARPSFRTPFAQHLAVLGLKSAARRAEDPGYQVGFGWRNGKRKLVFFPFDSMLRSDHDHADKLAESQLRRFLPIRARLWGECFSTLEFALRLPDNVNAKKFLMRVRRLIRRDFPHSISKIGMYHDWLTVKVLNFDPLDPDEAARFAASLSCEGIRLRWNNRAHIQYDQQLRKLLAPDLPEDDETRARFEYILKGIQQTRVHSRALSNVCEKQPSHKLKHDALPKSPVPDRPMDPETGERADFYTLPMSANRKLEEIEPHEWIPFPMIQEIDATTPEEYAQMLATC